MEGGNYATASMLAAGLWQALISTAGSLVVAIPSHLAYHFLSGRVRAIVRDVEWAGNEIMQYLLIEYRRAPGNGDGAATERPGRGDEVETVRPHRPGSP
jgi:biopolymer transport protein ExbB